LAGIQAPQRAHLVGIQAPQRAHLAVSGVDFKRGFLPLELENR
jgi:hypothetical protein